MRALEARSRKGHLTLLRFQSSPKGPPSKGSSQRRLKANNREAVLVWLTHYNNRFGSAGREGIINLQALPKPGPSFGPLDNAGNLERLDSEYEYHHDKTMLTVIAKLKAERWPLYMILKIPYLDADASPSVVEKWRVGAQEGGVGEGIQYGMHEDAITWILDNLPPGFVLDVPARLQVARGDIDAARQRRRQRARMKFFSYEAELGSTEAAVKKVVSEEGYSRKEVYRIISESRGKKKRKK